MPFPPGTSGTPPSSSGWSCVPTALVVWERKVVVRVDSGLWRFRSLILLLQPSLIYLIIFSAYDKLTYLESSRFVLRCIAGGLQNQVNYQRFSCKPARCNMKSVAENADVVEEYPFTEQE